MPRTVPAMRPELPAIPARRRAGEAAAGPPAAPDNRRAQLLDEAARLFGAKGYEHKDVEARWYPFWRDRGYFRGDERDT